jgi:hypothetical protein
MILVTLPVMASTPFTVASRHLPITEIVLDTALEAAIIPARAFVPPGTVKLPTKALMAAKDPANPFNRFKGAATKAETTANDACINLDLFSGAPENKLVAAIVPARAFNAAPVFDKAPEKADTAAKEPINLFKRDRLDVKAATALNDPAISLDRNGAPLEKADTTDNDAAIFLLRKGFDPEKAATAPIVPANASPPAASA